MAQVELKIKRDGAVQSVALDINPTIGNLEGLARAPEADRIDLLADDAKIEQIVLHPRVLVTVAFAISNAEEIGVTPEEFAKACGGAEFKRLRQEVFSSLNDFFLAIGQTDKAARLLASEEATAEMRAKLAREVSRPETKEILLAAIDGDKLRASVAAAVAEKIGG